MAATWWDPKGPMAALHKFNPLRLSYIRAQAAALCQDGLTAEELARAKAKVVGQRKIARQDLGGFALACALDELYGLGFRNHEGEDARYEAVTLDDVRAATGRYLRPDSAVVAIVRGG